MNRGIISEIIAYIILLFFGISTIIWIDNLEKNNCKCSEDLRRSYIKYWWIFIVLFNTIFLGYTFYNTIESNIVKRITFIITFIDLIVVFLSLSYIIKLRNSGCKCAENIGQYILLSYDILTIIMLALLLLLGIFLFVTNNLKFIYNGNKFR